MPDLCVRALHKLDVADGGAAGFQCSAKVYSELIRDSTLWYQVLRSVKKKRTQDHRSSHCFPRRSLSLPSLQLSLPQVKRKCKL